MSKFFSWIYSLYVAFRRAIGWYRVREIWVADLPIELESEVHVDSLSKISNDIAVRKDYVDVLNLHKEINWNDCWMERVRYIGCIGEWQKHIPNVLFVASCMINDLDPRGKDLMDSIYLPREILDETRVIDGCISLLNDDGGIPDVCIIHHFDSETEARIDLKLRIDRMTESIGPSNVSSINDLTKPY